MRPTRCSPCRAPCTSTARSARSASSPSRPPPHNDGSSSDPSALMEGTRLQLDPSLNVDALQIPAWEKPVARAMQVYGMYLRDQGGSFAIYAENPVGRGYDAWSKAGLPGGDNAPLTGVPWNKLRVVSAPSC